MKILYHFRTQGTGAEGVHIAGIARALEGLGHSVEFSSPTGIDPRFSAGANPFGGKRKSWLGYLAALVPRFIFEPVEMAYNLVAWRRHARILREQRFNLIYERHAFFLCSTALLAKRFRIPLVVEVNELAGDERVRAKPFFQGIARLADKLIFRAATVIVTVSPHLKRRIEALGVKGSKVIVLPNAVEESWLTFPNRRQEIRDRLGLRDEIVVSFVGWFVPWHRLKRLVEVFAKVVAEHPNIRLLLIGDGPQKRDLLRQVEKLGVRDTVLFPGSVSHSEVPAYLDASDISVVPHSNEYRSPIKLFEAMARGKLVIAPRTEPVEAVVVDGESALLFDPENVIDLQQCLLRAIELLRKNTPLGDVARLQISNRHKWIHNARVVMEKVSAAGEAK